ncbi:MAG: T9SS type A sorting domain-containing protein [Candidatus Marinimicrobia bacterium]|nr:T9SS type A sorting domain-containing protein [Candidatus Neomarinimicrobiota bacterium]
MKLYKILIILILSVSGWSQIIEETNIPCKPLSQMANHYDRLARSSMRTDVWDWNVYYYDLYLDINVETEIIYGAVEVHFKPVTPDLEYIQLDFVSDMTIDSVYLNGAVYNHASDVLSITLDGSYNIGENIAVGVAYHGHPEESGFQAFEFGTQYNNVGGIPMISTLSEPYGAPTWWPCKDVPTDKADSVRVSITVDNALTAVANGMLTAEMDNLDGTKTWVWEHKYPVTTYLVSLAITEYEYWVDTYHFADGDSMPLEYWMYPSYATDTNVDRWNLTGNMMAIYDEAYGEYPFSNEKYGMAQFGWGGAMEHQTCSSMGSSGENTIAHELAHQWWGDLVTCSNFHHIWINEGFATYSEALYWGEKNGELAYHAHMASKDNDYSGSIYRSDTTNVWSIFNYIVYGKGAWTLHMLRHVIGDDNFFETLAQYRHTYQFSHASTENFQSSAEVVWGQDLEWFFDQWIYGSGKPNYDWWWSAAPIDEFGHSEVTVHVDQVQDAAYPIFKMPIDLIFEGSGGDTTIIIWDSLQVQEFSLQLDFEPTAVNFDEEVWIHKNSTQVAGIDDQAFQPVDFRLFEAYPNPFNAEVTLPYIVNSHFEGELSIFNLRGSQVYKLALVHDSPGHYSVKWSGLDDYGLQLPSGIYIARILRDDQVTASQKISLLK